MDAPQAALSFLVNQAYTINAQVYATQYPDLDFGRLVYVDESAPEWTPGVTTFMSSTVGRAEWVSGAAKDVPNADILRDRNDVKMHMAAIGYEYNIEELGQAEMLVRTGGPGLTDAKASGARRAYVEFMWNVTLSGDTTKGLLGLSNQTAVTIGTAPADGTGSVTTWFDAGGNATKTAAQMVRDLNSVLTGVFVGTNTIEMADTVLLPHDVYAWLASTTMSSTNSETVLSFMLRTNIYTMRTGQQLTIRGELGLSTAGSGSTRRMVAYANRQDVVKLHLPMRHRFLTPREEGSFGFKVPGMFRTGGVEVLRTGAFRYLDGI